MTTSWAIPPRPPRLPADELHVWRVPLDRDAGAVAALSATLTPDECARADRFRQPHDRRRFVVARGTLRALLGPLLGCAPTALDFAYGPQGKPSLPAMASDPPLAFNVSHSGDLALIALRWGGPVGVDIEQARPQFDWSGIAVRFYSPGELAWLRGLPAADQTAGFFRLWTRKEAYLKARGEGVWHELCRFDVTRSPVSEAGIAFADTHTVWHLQDLDAGAGWRAAVCVQGPMPVLRAWQWEQ